MADDFVSGLFYFHGRPLNDGARWGMSLKKAGSMSFRWEEENPVRNAFLSSLAPDKTVAQVELIHSRTVFAVSSAQELEGRTGDGIITQNRNLLPVVTVADCMPIFLYEPVSRVFGTLHSGWKGTGIVREALLLAQKVYGSDIRNFCVVMGPHIHDCCYKIDEERAQYFRVNFCPECISQRDGAFYLSLAKANIHVLLELGVSEDSIVCSSDCTCCSLEFGSFRRQTASLPASMPMEEKRRHFAVQAAWTSF